MPEDRDKQNNEKFQRFDEVASKLFKVPMSEIKELEDREKQAKRKQDNPASEF